MTAEKENLTERACPWCGTKQVAVHKVIEKPRGRINEYRCRACGKILGAYLEEGGDFLPRIRAYPN